MDTHYKYNSRTLFDHVKYNHSLLMVYSTVYKQMKIETHLTKFNGFCKELTQKGC